jgi:hypothetical protein
MVFLRRSRVQRSYRNIPGKERRSNWGHRGTVALTVQGSSTFATEGGSRWPGPYSRGRRPDSWVYLPSCNTLQLFTLRSDGAYVRPFALVPVVLASAALLVTLAPAARAQQVTPPATQRPTALPIVPGARVKSRRRLVSPHGELPEMKATPPLIEAAAGGASGRSPSTRSPGSRKPGDKRYNRGPMLKGQRSAFRSGRCSSGEPRGFSRPPIPEVQPRRYGTSSARLLGVVGAIGVPHSAGVVDVSPAQAHVVQPVSSRGDGILTRLSVLAESDARPSALPVVPGGVEPRRLGEARTTPHWSNVRAAEQAE